MEDIKEQLIEEVGTSLNFWKHRPGASFSLVMSDESGYISLDISKNEWSKIKEKVDLLIEKI